MLCLGFICTLFVLHVFHLRSTDYRKLSTHQQIKTCYKHLKVIAHALMFFYSNHTVLRHYGFVHPNPYLLLWLVPETKGFNCVLACSTIHPYLGLVVAATHPLSLLEAIVVLQCIYAR